MESAVQMIVFNAEELRTRLRAMTDEKLRQFGQAARYMCMPEESLHKSPLPIYVLQLKAATAEWRRRHPNNWQSESVTEQ
jgi:hypothetical protein